MREREERLLQIGRWSLGDARCCGYGWGRFGRFDPVAPHGLSDESVRRSCHRYAGAFPYETDAARDRVSVPHVRGWVVS